LKDDGFGLAWNPNKKGQILSASDGKVVALWDVESYSKGNKELAPLHLYTKGHNSVVEDVAWHCQHDSLFASVGDDSHLLLYVPYRRTNL
jgi:histone-binding protein RBBP4